MNQENKSGADVIADIMRWHLPAERQQGIETLSAEIWAKATAGEVRYITGLAMRTARQVGEHLEGAGVKLSRREAADITNRVQAALFQEARRRGLQDAKPRPHLFNVAPYDDED